MKYLGKVLYPRLPAWQAKRQARHFMAAFTVALLFGVLIVAVMYFQNARR